MNASESSDEKKASSEPARAPIQKGEQARFVFFDVKNDQKILNPETQLEDVLEEVNNSYYSGFRHGYSQAYRDKCNFTAEASPLRMGAAQYIAKKEAQEDRMTAGTLSSSFINLTQKNKERFIKSIPLALHLECKAERFGSGAPMTMIIRRGNELHNINVGDCVAMVAYVKENGEIDAKHAKQINREHGLKTLEITSPPGSVLTVKDPTTPGHYLRVAHYADEGIYRLYGGSNLNLYQAIGDFSSEVAGLTHAGEYYSPIQIDSIKPADYDPKKYKQRIFLSSDALKDSLPTVEECRTVFEASSKKEKHPRKIAQDIVVTAMAKKTFDNFTFLVSDSDPESTAVEYFVIADGHCGDQVSEFIRQNVHRVAEHCLAKVVAQQALEQKIVQQVKNEIARTDPVFYAEITDMDNIDRLYQKFSNKPQYEKHCALLGVTYFKELSDQYQYLMAHSSGAFPDCADQMEHLRKRFLRAMNNIVGLSKDFFVYKPQLKEIKLANEQEGLSSEIKAIDAHLEKLKAKENDELLQFYFKHDPELSFDTKKQFTEVRDSLSITRKIIEMVHLLLLEKEKRKQIEFKSPDKTSAELLAQLNLAQKIFNKAKVDQQEITKMLVNKYPNGLIPEIDQRLQERFDDLREDAHRYLIEISSAHFAAVEKEKELAAITAFSPLQKQVDAFFGKDAKSDHTIFKIPGYIKQLDELKVSIDKFFQISNEHGKFLSGRALDIQDRIEKGKQEKEDKLNPHIQHLTKIVDALKDEKGPCVSYLTHLEDELRAHFKTIEPAVLAGGAGVPEPYKQTIQLKEPYVCTLDIKKFVRQSKNLPNKDLLEKHRVMQAMQAMLNTPDLHPAEKIEGVINIIAGHYDEISRFRDTGGLTLFGMGLKQLTLNPISKGAQFILAIQEIFKKYDIIADELFQQKIKENTQATLSKKR